MANSSLKKFLVLYLVPTDVMADWPRLTRLPGRPPNKRCKATGNVGWPITRK